MVIDMQHRSSHSHAKCSGGQQGYTLVELMIGLLLAAGIFDQIYVQPHSILGSIGVVGGKITLGGLYDWAGVNIVRRSRGPGGDLFNSVEPFNDEQRATVRTALTMIYDQFVERVEMGRGDRLPDVGQVAEGRLFTGAQTIHNGMADRMGGIERAVADKRVKQGDTVVVLAGSPSRSSTTAADVLRIVQVE